MTSYEEKIRKFSQDNLLLLPQIIGTGSGKRISKTAQAYLNKLSATHVEPSVAPKTRSFKQNDVKLSKATLQQIETYLQANLSNNIKVDDIAQYVGVSRTQFTRRIMATTGMSPSKLIMNARINAAKELLASSTLSLAQIARKTGFSSGSHFTSVFRNFTNSKPLMWRRQNSGSVAVKSAEEPSIRELDEFSIQQTSLWIDDNVRLLKSSKGLGWKDTFAAQTDELPCERAHVPVDAVWLAASDRPCSIRRITSTGRWDRTTGKHTVSLLGSAEMAHDTIHAPVRAYHLYLRQSIIDEVAEEIFPSDKNRLRIIETFGADDLILYEAIHAIMTALYDPTANGRLKIDYLSRVLAVHLLTHYSEVGSPKTVSANTFSAYEASIIRDYVSEHLSSSISLEDLATLMGTSRTNFCQRFKATTADVTPQRYITARRVSEARRLLGNPKLENAQIAAICGFSDQSHFITTFRRFFGVTPNQYRQIIS
ncbi:MAG: AraC family transcriptional regulator [Gemmobacter sp.]|jgi:AraC family transcriptional regulator|nr:AraC family transcriptional regulator [Gemmobacter sp.]